MNALRDKHVQFWLMALILVAGIVGGAFVGAYLKGGSTVVYDYTLALGEYTANDQVRLQYGVWPALANAEFYKTVRDEFIAEKANFVTADLTNMKLAVYRDGVPVLTVPIKSKGREGSWWETPSGLYKAESKKELHFSSFGQVYMPYNIPFQGNFFIHGWPYYPDGTPVAEGYSGGCMRLEDQYAAQVYELVEVGMPILVFEEEDEEAVDFSYTLDVPMLSANGYLVADLDSNFVLLSGQAEEEYHTRLVSRIMAALVIAEHMNIESKIPVTADMLVSGTSTHLTVGTSYRLYDLLFPLLLEGDEDVARVLEKHYGINRFVSLMNNKATAVGMIDTHFVDVTGESQGNITTAEDVFMLLKYLRANRSFVLDITAGKDKASTYGSVAFGEVHSTHPFYTDYGYVGGLVDTTVPGVGEDTNAAAVLLVFASSTQARMPASGDMVTVLRRTFNGVERTLALIALDAKRPKEDTQAMLRHVELLYR